MCEATSVGALQHPLRGIRNSSLMSRSTSVIGRDRGLQARMLLTMFLLGALYVVFMAVLFAAGAGMGLIVALAAGMLLLQYFGSDKLALASMRAREVTPQEAPELHGMIDRLCVQADLPKPRVAMVESTMPNAFALGRSPKHATVCATTAIVDLLTPAELEGAFAEGIGFDGSAIEGFARVSEADMVARPDPSTFQVLPWTTSGGDHLLKTPDIPW